MTRKMCFVLSPSCTVDLTFEGELTDAGLRQLMSLLDVARRAFPAPKDGTKETVVVRPDFSAIPPCPRRRPGEPAHRWTQWLSLEWAANPSQRNMIVCNCGERFYANLGPQGKIELGTL